jgi:DNA repair protein RadC
MNTQFDLFGNLVELEHQTRRLPFRKWQLREGNVLYRCGASNMSNTHLLAHLLRNQSLAEQLMEHFGSLSAVADASFVELKQVPGVGVATAETIKVSLELSKRLTPAHNGEKTKITKPQDAYLLLCDEYRELKQEVLKVLVLNTKNGVEHVEDVFVGALNSSIVHPREIFNVAIRHYAASIIITHNHPSGDPTPSNEDIRATRQIVEAGTYIQIPLLDHIIIGLHGYVSLKEEGIIT